MNKEVKREDVAKGLSAICTDALAHSASLQLGETREAMSAIKSFSSLFAVTETCAGAEKCSVLRAQSWTWNDDVWALKM